MGLNRNELPDALLRRVSPQDRKSVGLPPPMSEIVSRAAAKSDAKREKDLQNKIENFLRLRGITPIRSGMHRKTSNNLGCPDFLFAVNGRAVAIEAKLPGEKPSEDQAKMLMDLAKNGWAVKVVYSLDEARFFVAALL